MVQRISISTDCFSLSRVNFATGIFDARAFQTDYNQLIIIENPAGIRRGTSPLAVPRTIHSPIRVTLYMTGPSLRNFARSFESQVKHFFNGFVTIITSKMTAFNVCSVV